MNICVYLCGGRASSVANGILLFLLFLALSGCATTSGLVVPILPAPHRSLPPDEPAVIRIPVIVDLPDAGVMEQQAVKTVESGSLLVVPVIVHAANMASLQVWRDPVALKFAGNIFSTSLKLHYLQKDAQDSLVKEAVVRAKSALQWSEDWHVESSGLGLPSVPKILTPGEIGSFVGQAGAELLKKGTDDFNAALLDATNLQPRAKELWAQVQEPVYLEKGIWLVIKPESVSVGKSRILPTQPAQLETLFEMTVFSKVIFGAKPSTGQSPLPPLRPFVPGPNGFHAASNLKIGYREANFILRQPKAGILGRVIPQSGDRKLTIKDIRLYGSGGQIVVEAKMEYNPILNLSDKPAEMTLYLRGTPRFRKEKRIFDFPDLDFDIKTSDFLVQAAEWIFKSDMRRELRRQARIPVGPKLDQIKDRINEVLNRQLDPNVKLTTKVTSLKVLEAFATNEGLESRLAMDGDALLNVSWK